jgi:hypothetical protein
MTNSAPRFPWPLVVEIRRLAASDASPAQIRREVGRFADAHGFQRPSYEAIRRLVRRERDLRALPGITGPVLDGLLRVRSLQNAADEAFRRAERRAAAKRSLDGERAWRPGGAGDGDRSPPCK